MKTDWFETFSDDLWLKPDEEGADEAAFIRKALRLRRGQRVLDAPCGAGRIAIHLAEAGLDVTGIDMRGAFIGRAVARFRREKRHGHFMAMDLRDMTFSEEFHGVYNWSGSFGYFADTENVDVMARYAAALRRGGRLLVDQPNREAMLRHFVASCRVGGRRGGGTWNVRAGRSELAFKARNRWDADSERVESDWIVDRDGTKQHNLMSIRLYTPGQMARLLERVGLSVEAVYGSRGGEPYTRMSRRLIVVGRK